MATLVVLGAADGAVPTYAAARRIGLRTVSVDMRPDAPAVQMADEYLPVSTTDVDAVAAKLAGRRDLVGVVAPASDVALPGQLTLARALRLPTGLSPRAVRASLDKGFFRRLVSRAGLPGPAAVTGDADTVVRTAGRLGMPLVVKPVDATGSRGVAWCRRPEELPSATLDAAASSRTSRVIAEAGVLGSHRTVEALVQGGRVVFAATSERVLTDEPYFITREHRMAPRAGGDSDALVDLLNRLCATLDYRWGPLDVDLVVDPTGTPQLIEAGARLGGNGLGDVARAAYGVDVTELAIRMAIGEPVHPTATVDRHAHLRVLTAPRAGVVTAVRDVDGARAVPGVCDVHVVVRPGDRVRPYVEAAAKLGYLIASGDDAVSAAGALDAAEQRLRIETRPDDHGGSR